MIPQLISGDSFFDQRGTLFYNNNFDASFIKRMYIIENINIDYVRGWQGHKIEQRWFSVIRGSFRIRLIKIDNWDKPSKSGKTYTFLINSEKLDVLHVPQGYASSIQSLEINSRLLVMANYLLGETKDEYRYAADFFES